MPRNRPAAGVGDNTLDGEFSSDLGGGDEGGGSSSRAAPREIVSQRSVGLNPNTPLDAGDYVHLFSIVNTQFKGGTVKGLYSVNGQASLFNTATDSFNAAFGTYGSLSDTLTVPVGTGLYGVLLRGQGGGVTASFSKFTVSVSPQGIPSGGFFDASYSTGSPFTFSFTLPNSVSTSFTFSGIPALFPGMATGFTVPKEQNRPASPGANPGGTGYGIRPNVLNQSYQAFNFAYFSATGSLTAKLGLSPQGVSLTGNNRLSLDLIDLNSVQNAQSLPYSFS